MTSYVNKPTSLVERKKQQWAREREELAGLSAPWGFLNHSTNNLSSGHVTKLVSAAPTTDVFARRESNASRRQSLPPIYKKIGNSYAPNERYDKELGGETSGYGSDNPNNTPEYFQNTAFNQSLGYESSSSARDDRAKWGERGAGIGKFWDPQDVKYCHKMDDTPGWVKRGLQEGTELIISNTSPAESPEQDYGERPYTSSTISQTRTYIRGQNNPVDPVELTQRELKRQAARAHQEAIKQQLEEREQKRREEREQKIKEEYEEELRIAREQELERKRREREQQLALEKQEKDRKRKEALQEAIKSAEKEAQERKIRQKLLRQTNVNINENVIEKEKIKSPRPIASNNLDEDVKNNIDKIYNIHNINDSALQAENEKSNNAQLIINHNNTSSNNNYNNNSNNAIKNEKNDNLNRVDCSSTLEFSNLQSPRQQETPLSKSKVNNAENTTRSIQTPLEGYANIPFAILMPTFNGSLNPSVPIVLPMQINNNEPINTPRTENKVLTPTLYRNKRVSDSSTQTDFKVLNKNEVDQSREIKYIKEKLNNLELADEAKSRSENKSRSSDKLRENSGERPKWGANRPPTRYMKQSEKDPFYNRKKTRQKIRQIKLFDDKNNNYSAHSSDDSQVASPRSYRNKKGYIEKRRTRALWQKHGQVFSRNLQVYQTEIMPLESDSNQIYYKKSNCMKCCCDCRSNNHKYSEEVKVVDILKIEHTPREDVKRKKNSLPECPSSSIDGDILEKLNSLHNELLMKQEQWQNSPSTPSLSSSSRVTEMMAKVDDFLGKKKEVAPILDLSKSTAKTAEEFRKLLDKVPDFKIKSERVRGEDIKIKDKHFKFKTGKKDYKSMKEPFLYQNPIPNEMRSLKLKDLVSISIDWKMLTTLRPKNKIDEEFFSRLVELGKSELKTAASDKRALALDSQIRKCKNKAGVIEMRPASCKDCGEDFCTGKACMKFSYDYFVRIPETLVVGPLKAITTESSKNVKKKKKIKRKSRGKVKAKDKSRNKSKSPKKHVTKKTK